MGAKRCHVLSQPQQIDWITREIKPVVEAHLGDSLVLEYSRPMRGFTAADSTTTRYYDGTGSLSYNPTTNPNPYAYAVVPDSYTQMDQLKLSGMVNDDNRVYAFLMAGNTVNQEISMNRWFNDMDVRWTNTSLQNVSLTGYGTIYNEAEQMPNAATVTAVNQGPATCSRNQHPADQHHGEHRPRASHRLSQVHGRPERHVAARRLRLRLRRVGDHRRLRVLRSRPAICGLRPERARGRGARRGSHTITNSFQVGPDYRWSACFDTYLHYKFQNADQPLLGVQESNGLVNTPLPQHDHIVEIGFNWVPTDCFVFNACVGIERGDTHGLFGDSATPINFDEENYPMSFSVWYAVSQKLSVSAGYAVYSNFVAQDISVADQSTYTTGSTSAAPPSTSRWNYGGRAQVVTLGSRYPAPAWTSFPQCTRNREECSVARQTRTWHSRPKQHERAF